MFEFVNGLLDSKDNVIEQLNLLKKYKNNKEVKKYMSIVSGQNNSPYLKNCIDKYYYNLEVDEKIFNEQKKNVKLYKICILSTENQKIEKIQKKDKNLINKVRIRDEVKLLEGPYAGMEGIVKKINKINKEIVVEFDLLGIKIECECKDKFEIIRRDNNVK